MRRFILFLALAALMASNVMAGNIGQQTAQRIGQQFLSTTVLGQDRAALQLDLVRTEATRGEVDYYVFNVRGGNGFVVVAGDNRVKPILAYSTSGSFDPEDVAEGFEFTLNSYRHEIQYIRENNMVATPDIAEEWKSVMENGQVKRGRQARAVVGPLCQTLWNQNFPWNSQCPEDPEGDGGHVYAGCVATAIGQVMKFWDYPERGIGSHSYNPEGYAQQTANFGETDYHFELMPLVLDSTSTEEDYFYIAQFLHHCGIAVNMQYSGHGSGAYTQDVPGALTDYFGFTVGEGETLGYWGWNFFSNEEWAQMLKDGGLDEHMPLYYSGSDDGGAGGHAYVCDGYDENDYFHFNWGWSGRDNAWCAIGALNTTKYAFNDMNQYIGHIVPQNSDYYLRADSVANFIVDENRDFTGVTLSWTNPSADLNGNALTSIETINIRRNNQPLVTLDNVQVGANMSYEDNELEPGLYEYAISVTNANGISRNAYRTILVGEKCEVVFQLHDAGGDGWKGAAISVADENGARIAVVTMTEGTEATVTQPLLRQNLSFVWNHGWFHNSEGYDTDGECSFSIYDADGNELYVSGELEDGVFMTYENNCEQGALTCHPVRNLHGEYQWHNGEEFGALLIWDRPAITANLDHFQVYRTTGAYKEEELIAEIPFNGSNSYEFFDNTYGMVPEDTYYAVNSVYVRDDEQCESEYLDVMVHITDVAEHNAEVRVYPNPTQGQLRIDGQGVMRVIVSNLLGQRLLETVVEDNASIDMGQLGRGVYMVRIETEQGANVKKVTVK